MNRIELTYNGKDYVLEYNRKAVEEMEAHGFSISKMEDRLMTSTFLMFRYAFYKNHRGVHNDERLMEEILSAIDDKSELTSVLGEMISDTYKTIMSDNEEPKNVAMWKKVK